MNNIEPIQQGYKLTKIPSVGSLDAAVEKVNGHAKKAAEHVYKLGGELKKIRDKSLWEARVDDKGIPKYGGFWQFCAAEINISDSYIRRLMQIHDNYSLSDVKKHGVAKLSVSMTLPKPKRKMYLKAVTHVPACSPEVRQIARDMQSDNQEDVRKHIIPNNVAKTSVPLGIQLLPMYNGKPHGDGKPQVKAKTLSDNPVATTQLSKKVSLDIRFTRNEGGYLIAVLEIRENGLLDE